MNKQQKGIALMAGSLVAVLLVVQGCDLRKQIEVDVPPEVAAVLKVEQPITLANAEQVYTEWTAWGKRTDEAFVAAIDEAQTRYEFVHKWTTIGLSVVGEASQGIPYGGLLFGALTGAVGLMLPQPKLARKKKADPAP